MIFERKIHSSSYHKWDVSDKDNVGEQEEFHILKTKRFLILSARFYKDIAALLEEGACSVLEKAKLPYTLVSVPGAFDLPVAAALLCQNARHRSTPYDGLIALGCVIRGETYHFEIVAQESARGLMLYAITQYLPLGNGILTVNAHDQAYVRADPAQGNKGAEAARACLTLAELQAKDTADDNNTKLYPEE